MKIAFLGKGGSGKSTMATALVTALRESGYRVLAIDADHNMDLTYNLGADPTLFLGTDPERIKEHVGVPRAASYKVTLQTARDSGIMFSLSPTDSYTKSVTTVIDDNFLLMTAGPHTDRVRSQAYCSHSLAAPLKVYLPLLRLLDNEAVVIDERAGTDPVATGILYGVDLAVIVQEPSIHSRRVAEQIKGELELAGVPYCIVDNKQYGVEVDTVRAVEMILARA